MSQIPRIILPEDMHCFKYHYQVQVPFMSEKTGDAVLIESNYTTTGWCSPLKIHFPCEDGNTHVPISSCNLNYTSDLKMNTMSLAIEIEDETVVTVDLNAYPNKDQ